MRAGLTRDLLAQRGLAVVDADGLAALTMRRLASEVGVEAASLYNHVRGKEDLLDAVVERARDEMRLPEQWPADWRDGLALIFEAYLAMLLAHPHLIPLAGRRTAPGPTGIDLMVAEGLPRPDAEDLWQAALALTLGFASFASGTTPEAGTWHPETYRRALSALIGALTGGPT